MTDTRFIEREIAGERLTVDLETATAFFYEEDPMLNHVQLGLGVVNSSDGGGFRGVRIVRLFNAPEDMVFFSGVRMPIEGKTDEEIQELSTSLLEATGRMIQIVASDKAPDLIRDRYISLFERQLGQLATVEQRD